MKEHMRAADAHANLPEPFYLPFLKYVEESVAVDEEARTLIAGSCKLVNFDKGQRLLNMGSVCKYVYFILSGECRSYLTDSFGKTTTWFFHFNKPESNLKNLFAVDYKSFLSANAASISIETLSPVTAIRFSVDDVQALSAGSQAIERWLRLLNEQAYMLTCDRIITRMTLSAPDRYKKLLDNEPYLLNMFSNHLVATYLNVAPQSLSRIRGRISSGRL
jgi:CRP-like cAMP-binding protein